MTNQVCTVSPEDQGPNTSSWSVEECWRFIDNKLSIDVNTIDDIANDDVEGWRLRVVSLWLTRDDDRVDEDHK